MADPPFIALPPTSDSKMQKKGKKLSKIGMGALPTDVFIRSLRTYGEKPDKPEDSPQKTCSKGHQPTTLMTSSRSSSSCSRTPQSRSTIYSLT